MKKFQFKRVRSRFVFWFMVVSVMPLLTFSIVMYYQQSSSMKKEAFDKLTAIRDLKVEQVNNWLQGREGDLRTIAGDFEIRGLEQVFSKESRSAENLRMLENARELFQRYLYNYDAFFEIFMIHPLSGEITLSTEPTHEGLDKSKDPYFTKPLKSGELYIRDIYYSRTEKEPVMTFSVPVFGLTDTQQIVGILVARIDLKNTLYPLLLRRTGMGETGETLIVNKDVVALNELRWYDKAPLKLQIQAKPAVNASRGETGIIEANDYRTESVLAAYTYIPKTQWGMVAKQDLKELYLPINTMLKQLIGFVIAAILVVYVVALLVARNIAEPLITISDISGKIARGNLSLRFQLQREDEFGDLSQTLNTMTESLEFRMDIQQGNIEFSNIMVTTDDLKEFRPIIMKYLVEKTGSCVGVYYRLDRVKNVFEPLFSIGASSDLLHPFVADEYEGELGHALVQKKIFHIINIPVDTSFVFTTTAGAIIPKEMITIPIIIDNTIEAVISLATLNSYTKAHLELLEQNRITLNTKISNLYTAEKIKSLVQEMNAKNQELEVQARELQEQAKELEQQNLELEIKSREVEEANRLKSEFLSNMSHELRTPLNSVIALSRVLIMQARQKISEEEFGYLEIIERNGKHLLHLINDILDLSKIEAGRVEVNSEEFSIGKTVDMVRESLEPLAEEKDVEIRVNIPEDFPMIISDEAKVRQILQNVMGNAVKFTERGFIEITATHAASTLYLSVKDTGIGIPEDALPHIFEEFRQVDGSAARRYEGTGLGLSIALRYARLLDGNISVESTLGQGSTFTLRLPLKPSAMPVKEENMPIISPLQPQQGAKTVLIVDNEPWVIMMISVYLSQAGYKTLAATSGKEALQLARSHHPFAMTLDIIMPEMDGWETLQRLKADPGTADIPVIIVSVAEDKDTAFALGAVGYITKPVHEQELIAEIRRVAGTSAVSVMIVDDNAIDRQQEVRIVEGEGMKAIAAESGSQCLDLLQESVPDVLVLDLIMPEMDGFSMLDTIRHDPRTRDLPVIVVTAKDLTPQEKQRLHGDVSSILTKAVITPQELLNRIKASLAQIEKQSIAKPLPEVPRLLLVEDSEPAIIQIRNILEKNGYLVDVARGGQEAIDYVHVQIPDGVILDLMMPEVDGFDVLERIRSHEATARIPVLILTAKDLTPEDLSRLSVNNIQQLVQKGDVNAEQLLFKIQLMLGSEPKLKPTYDIPKSPLEGGQGGVEPLEGVQESVEPLDDLKSPLEGGGIPLSGGGRGGFPFEDVQKTVTPPFEGDRGVSSKPTILAVEDNPDNMITIKAILQHTYHVLDATDGEEGLKKAIEQLPDLILLDMSLPKMDGFEVVSRLKGDKKTRSIPVIALTAHAMKGDREKVLNAGCDDYIFKPVDPEQLQACVKKWLNAATKTRRHEEERN